MPNYNDIINITRPISKKRKPMSVKKRSAQFAPFKALKEYQEKINEIDKLNNKIDNQTTKININISKT